MRAKNVNVRGEAEAFLTDSKNLLLEEVPQNELVAPVNDGVSFANNQAAHSCCCQLLELFIQRHKLDELQAELFRLCQEETTCFRRLLLFQKVQQS